MLRTRVTHGGLRSALLTSLVAMSALVPLSAFPIGVDGAERHAGTVLAVNAGQRTLTLDEFGANAVRQTRQVQLAPTTTVLVSERNEPVLDFNRVFTDWPISLADLREGDFVVVELSERLGVADRVILTLRRGVSGG